MKQLMMRWGAALFVVAAIAGCGGGGGGSAEVPVVPSAVSEAIAKASALASNDTAVNPSAPFAVVQGAGVPAVTINSPPVINFAVFSDGKIKTGLTTTNARFALAKLVPGSDGNPDQWVSEVIGTSLPQIAPKKHLASCDALWQGGARHWRRPQ